MRSLWNGMLSFGSVNIPIKLYSATRSQELRFHYLHAQDEGRITTEKICRKCGRTVEAVELMRGYEYEKGKYLSLTEEDFKKVEVGSTRALKLETFVDLGDIDPIFFDKPYYVAPEEQSGKLYTLLREALKRSRKVALAKLAFHDREHLVVIKPHGRALMLGILYFADEIAPPRGLALPKENEPVNGDELALAERLIASMAEPFEPEQYKDTYREGLLALIEKKREGVKIKLRALPTRKATEAKNLLAALQESIQKIEAKRRRDLAA